MALSRAKFKSAAGGNNATVGGSKPSGGLGYQDMLSRLVEEFKPGGTVETQRMKEADKAGEQLGAKLEASAVSRGLGNAMIGSERTVAESVNQAKGRIRSETLSQYLGTLQFLAQMQMRGEQAGLGSSTRIINSEKLGGQLGLDEGLGGRPAFHAPVPTGRHGADAFPSLYQAGGYGAGGTVNYQTAPDLFAGMDDGSPGLSDISYGTPMMGGSERWQSDTNRGRKAI
jgi:hypothetical protein